ncbi:hypothetical protein K432DRAFT_181404 [Lepidopterella palustris CBS 459.81]|uniref:Uncharacterized protein n=1 Tax=Lepidopterella palustris CBS 459.81 TaxID=1314670 RepID=A0A8E2EH21_9PEZI|nr:hypothetical protein K432DRAFT_181404 [Lepidopterella palustris CBS 459.81]
MLLQSRQTKIHRNLTILSSALTMHIFTLAGFTSGTKSLSRAQAYTTRNITPDFLLSRHACLMETPRVPKTPCYKCFPPPPRPRPPTTRKHGRREYPHNN